MSDEYEKIIEEEVKRQGGLLNLECVAHLRGVGWGSGLPRIGLPPSIGVVTICQMHLILPDGTLTPREIGAAIELVKHSQGPCIGEIEAQQIKYHVKSFWEHIQRISNASLWTTPDDEETKKKGESIRIVGLILGQRKMPWR